MFTFVTSSENKIITAKQKLDRFDIDFATKNLNLIEIQSDKIENVALFKIQQAYSELKSPTVVTDVGWYIKSLNGFPGPYMKYMNEWLPNKDFLQLLSDKTDRAISFVSVLVYKDANFEKLFSNIRTGQVLLEPSGIGKIEFDRIISFRSDKKSVAFCADNNLPKFDTDNSVWNDFAKWYTNKK